MGIALTRAAGILSGVHDAYAHYLALAFQLHLSLLELPEVEAGSSIGRIADQRLAGPCFLGKTRRDVHIVAQGSPVWDRAVRSAYASEVGNARVNANTNGKPGAASIPVAGGT